MGALEQAALGPVSVHRPFLRDSALVVIVVTGFGGTPTCKVCALGTAALQAHSPCHSFENSCEHFPNWPASSGSSRLDKGSRRWPARPRGLVRPPQLICQTRTYSAPKFKGGDYGKPFADPHRGGEPVLITTTPAQSVTQGGDRREKAPTFCFRSRIDWKSQRHCSTWVWI